MDVEMKCPFGYLIGKDFCQFPECDDGTQTFNECPPTIYYECRHMKCTCGDKSDFGSKIIAAKVARDMSTDLIKYMEYKCFYCGGWHIGKHWDSVR